MQVQDAAAPVVNAPAPIVVAATDASGTASSDPSISAYLSGATANDAVDGSLPVSHDAPTRFPLGVTVVTFSAVDSAGNTGSASSSVTVEDRDAPQITLLGNASLTVNVGDTFIDPGATAIDNVDGDLSAAIVVSGSVDTALPGSYNLVYSVSDQAGNSASVTRSVQVQETSPVVDFQPDQRAEAGQMVQVRFYLRGGNRLHVAEFHYRVSEQLSGRVLLSDGLVSVPAGIRGGEIEFPIPPDSQDEALVFEWIEGGNVRGGQSTEHRVWLVTENQAPLPAIHVDQRGVPVRWVQPAGGMVTVSGLVRDANAADAHSLDWSDSDARLLLGQEPGAVWQFDPSSLLPGDYRLVLVATDDGVPELRSRTETLLRVVSSLPDLSAGMDQDGDGLNDSEEGYDDGDEDGIPDFLDADEAGHFLVADELQPELRLQTLPGLRLKLGAMAFGLGRASAGLSLDDLQQYWNQSPLAAIDPAQQSHDFESGLFDFEIGGLPWAGQSVPVVLPLQAPIGDAAVYRKLMASGWQDFLQDANNSVASARSTSQGCPGPGSDLYRAGLNKGDECVLLWIEDGGPNDGDGLANGLIRDPGGVATPRIQSNDNSGSTSSGGGGALDWIGWLLLLTGLRCIHRFRIRRFPLPGRGSGN